MEFSPGGKRRVRAGNRALHAVIALASLAPVTVKAASPPSAMSPFVKLGPQAALSGVHGPVTGCSLAR